METKPNGIGGVGHKIEEEVEANFQKTSEAALWVKISDLCPERGKRFLLYGASPATAELWTS